MPVHLKLIISALALALCVGVYYMDSQAGLAASSWVALGLGPLMVFSIWIFPEAEARKIRADAARRRGAS